MAEVGEAIVPHRWAENAKMDDRPRVVKLLELELGKWDECISFIYNSALYAKLAFGRTNDHRDIGSNIGFMWVKTFRRDSQNFR